MPTVAATESPSPDERVPPSTSSSLFTFVSVTVDPVVSGTEGEVDVSEVEFKVKLVEVEVGRRDTLEVVDDESVSDVTLKKGDEI